MGLISALLGIGLSFAGAPSVNVGSPALQFSLPSLNEDTTMALVNKPVVALSDFAGLDPAYPRQALILYFCTRSKGGDALPALERLAKKYRGKDTQFVAILGDRGELGDLSAWVAGQNVSFPVLRDQHRIVSGRYGIDEWPLTYVLDSQGDVFAVGNPSGGGVEAEVDAAVDALLNGVEP